MGGWPRLPAALALLLGLAPVGAGAEERVPVHLCGLSSAAEVEAAVGLDEILATATLVPCDPGACRGPPASLRVMLVGKGPGKVAVLLEGPAMTLERTLPWLTSPDEGLANLARGGRLASFAIVLEALLAEYRLTAAALLPPPEEPPEPVAAAPEGRVERKRSTGPRRATVARTAPAPQPVPEPATPPAPPPNPEPPPRSDPPPAPKVPPVRTPIHLPGGLFGPFGPGAAPARAPVPAPELAAGIRVREPDLVAAEFGAGLRIGPVFATARFQPGTNWTVEDRPVSVSAMGFELGWLHPLWLGEDAQAHGRVAVLAERLSIRQLDIEEDADHEALDAGGELGLVLEARVIGGLWVTVGAEGIWLPTAGSLVIEDEVETNELDWVRVPFNGVGARATLAISWRR